MKVGLIPVGMPESERRWISDAYGPVEKWYEEDFLPRGRGYVVDADAFWMKNLETGEENRPYLPADRGEPLSA